MMVEISLDEAHERFLDVVHRAEDEKERVYLTRSGKRIAAIVPLEDVETIERIEGRIDRSALRRAEMVVPVRMRSPHRFRRTLPFDYPSQYHRLVRTLHRLAFAMWLYT